MLLLPLRQWLVAQCMCFFIAIFLLSSKSNFMACIIACANVWNKNSSNLVFITIDTKHTQTHDNNVIKMFLLFCLNFYCPTHHLNIHKNGLSSEAIKKYIIVRFYELATHRTHPHFFFAPIICYPYIQFSLHVKSSQPSKWEISGWNKNFIIIIFQGEFILAVY